MSGAAGGNLLAAAARPARQQTRGRVTSAGPRALGGAPSPRRPRGPAAPPGRSPRAALLHPPALPEPEYSGHRALGAAAELSCLRGTVLSEPQSLPLPVTIPVSLAGFKVKSKEPNAGDDIKRLVHVCWKKAVASGRSLRVNIWASASSRADSDLALWSSVSP